ncbi:hypothetical protein BDB01DRAFT_769606 [Pilobolus umbonatus]|nr:hypothetical protein BDB01DRAFT_769606 [Pilobolus umbonatus]
MTKTTDSAEAKRWIIIGAHQAGASERHIARIARLSTTAVRNIILNYQKTGIPALPKKIPEKVKQKLIVEYDEDGNIIESEDEHSEKEVCHSGITKKGKDKIKKIKTTITAKDIIRYAMDKMQIEDNRMRREDTGQSSSGDPVPVLSCMPQQTASDRLPPPSKYDQDIRGYEIWTHEDDMVLLNHVLHHLHGGGWNELEIRFDGRHSARLCYDRWKYLKSLLLKGITDKPDTPW